MYRFIRNYKTEYIESYAKKELKIQDLDYIFWKDFEVLLFV